MASSLNRIVQRERLILLSNLSNQVSDLSMKVNNIMEINNRMFIKLKQLDDRIPERKQGYWGGYWDTEKKS